MCLLLLQLPRLVGFRKRIDDCWLDARKGFGSFDCLLWAMLCYDVLSGGIITVLNVMAIWIDTLLMTGYYYCYGYWNECDSVQCEEGRDRGFTAAIASRNPLDLSAKNPASVPGNDPRCSGICASWKTPRCTSVYSDAYVAALTVFKPPSRGGASEMLRSLFCKVRRKRAIVLLCYGYG